MAGSPSRFRKRLSPGLAARLKTVLMLLLLQDAAQPGKKGRRNHTAKDDAHPIFPPSHLISFLWNPYRPAAVHTATQNAPTIHARPR